MSKRGGTRPWLVGMFIGFHGITPVVSLDFPFAICVIEMGNPNIADPVLRTGEIIDANGGILMR